MSDVNEINTYIKYFESFVVLQQNYLSYFDASRLLLFVEGPTDKYFIGKYLTHNVDCRPVKDILQSIEVLEQNTQNFNCRQVIVNLCRIKQLAPILEYKLNENEWPIYGLVDSDNRDDNPQTINTLFFTDTHDLETLILSTDIEILFRLLDCQITNDDIKKAFLLSYQIHIIKDILHDNYANIPLSYYEITIDTRFELFMKNNEINIPDFIKYLKECTNTELSGSRINEIINNVMESKSIRSLFNTKTNDWKISWSSFAHSSIQDFWHVVNGHTILCLITYFCEHAYNSFAKDTHQHNRAFENALIKEYDSPKFKTTKLYSNMKTAGLVV